jgi:hypothetical protein
MNKLRSSSKRSSNVQETRVFEDLVFLPSPNPQSNAGDLQGSRLFDLTS